MSFTRVIRPLLIGLSILLVVLLLGGRFLGPGVGDGATSIAAGYVYDDAGGYEKAIVYRGPDRVHTVVVDARVDEYRIDGTTLLVARRPRVTKQANDDTVDTSLLSVCEFWAIDLETHRVKKIPNPDGLHCH